MRVSGPLYRLFPWLALGGAAWADEPVLPVLPVLQTLSPAAYPERALERVIEGDVRLEITVSEDGSVLDVQLLESAGNGFDAPAIEAAWTMHFEPARDDKGRPVPARIEYRYLFRMADVAPLSMEGVVREQAGKKMIDGALIRAIGPDEQVARTRSDDRGRFRFAALAPGKWVLTVSGPTLATASSSVEVPVDGWAEGVVLQTERYEEWEQAQYDEVVEVTAERSIDPAQREISHEMIVTLPGSLGDPVRALQNLPGVSRAPFGSGQIIVRGNDPADTSYLINGTPIPFAFHFTAVSTVVAADMLSGLEFLSGSWGARYGRAIGGVVNLETRDELPNHGTTSASADLFQTTGFTRQRLGSATSVSMSARRSYADVILQPVLAAGGTTAIRVPRYYDAQIHLVRRIGTAGSFTATLLASDDRFRVLAVDGGDALSYHSSFQKGLLRYLQPTVGGFLVETSFSVGPEVQELTLSGEDGAVSDVFGVPIDLFEDLAVGQALEESIPRSAFRHEWTRDPGDSWLGMRVGLDAVWGQQNLVYTVGEPASARRPIWQPALYAEPTVRLGPLDLMPGVRIEMYDFVGTLMQTAWDPRLRGLLRVGQARVLGGYGLYSQAPAMRELLSLEGGSLGFERSRHMSLGVGYRVAADIDVMLTGYHQRSWDLVIGRENLFRFDRTSLAPVDDVEPFANEGTGEGIGLELLGTWTTETRLAWLAVSLSHATRVDRIGTEEHPSEADQLVNITAILSQEVRNWRLGGRMRLASGPALTPVVGGVYSTDLQTWLPVYGERWSDRAPAFFSLDTRVDRTWKLRRFDVGLYAEVQNVTNQQNVEVPGYNEDFTQPDPVTGLPIFPAIGVKGTW